MLTSEDNVSLNRKEKKKLRRHEKEEVSSFVSCYFWERTDFLSVYIGHILSVLALFLYIRRDHLSKIVTISAFRLPM